MFGSGNLAWLWALGIISVTVLGVVLAYGAVRRVLQPHATADTESLANSITMRIASLHVLILALVFAQEQVNMVDLRATEAREAASIADLFYDLDRYDPVANLHLRRALAEYVHVVIHEEWTMLASGHLSQTAWNLWDQVYVGVLNLTPTTPREDSLRTRMLSDIETISESRNFRNADAISGVTGLFWLVALSGIVFTVLPYFIYRPRPVNVTLLSLFAIYNGIVIYTILAMTNPYLPPAAVEPQPFQEIFEHDMADLLVQQ